MAVELSHALRAPATVQQMAEAAQRFLDSLSAEQLAKASFPFAGDERYYWHYTPIDRNGLKLQEMSAEQRARADALIASGLSPRAARITQQIIDLEPILKVAEEIENMPSRWDRDSGRYTVSVFGTPGGREPWAWRVGGHHIGISMTVIDGAWVAATPFFFGANPAEVRYGPATGLRTLPDEEDLARVLLGSLDAGQKSVAIVDPVAPADILSRAERTVAPDVAPSGIAYSRLSGEQRGHLITLVRHYVTRTTDEVSTGAWARIEDAGLDGVGFAWAGSEARGQGHYYVVKGPNFLIEYDNTQNEANHIHSVLRDFTNDWGEDWLAAHYAATHHNGHHTH